MDSSKTKKNYYEILGLKPNATDAEIENAYKKLSGQWHPDKNTDKRK
jgi:curved DNA-binding protein